MNKLKGYRTLIVNGVAVLVAVGALFGVIIPESETAAVIAGMTAVINIAMRFATDTKVGDAGGDEG